MSDGFAINRSAFVVSILIKFPHFFAGVGEFISNPSQDIRGWLISLALISERE
jgi:hypothetical protein